MQHKIPHVEDNPDDVMLVNMAFTKAEASVSLEVATDGDKAIAALQNGSEPLPVCVLLDIKLPSISGFEVLYWIRSQSRFKHLPVIMLTSSLLPKDINRAYDLGANSYLVKPAELDSLIALARTIDLYWLRTNIRPTAG